MKKIIDNLMFYLNLFLLYIPIYKNIKDSIESLILLLLDHILKLEIKFKNLSFYAFLPINCILLILLRIYNKMNIYQIKRTIHCIYINLKYYNVGVSR